jgi:SSS family transporter
MEISANVSLLIIALYFGLLITVSFLTNKKSTNKTFFTGDRSSPWYLVAFGMIGASLSGITFISVPGTIYNDGLTYLSIVFGFFVGYLVIIGILLPIYYKLNLTSIYSYLKGRFGNYSYKTGASFFLISRVVGASLRLYLVAEVLDIFIFKPFGIPYYLGIVFTILLIWVYTFKGGIKTIVWTDTLQTASMLIAVGVTIYFIKDALNFSWFELADTAYNSEFFKVVHWKDKGWSNFFIGIINGAFITIVMTGLDQDMMQKNLSCRNLKDAQKNMFWFGTILIPVNLLFLVLGIMLYTYVIENNFLEVIINANQSIEYYISSPDYSSKTLITADKLFPTLAAKGYFPPLLGIVFLIGLIAAAYSSADSALTSLTTSFCVDIIENENNPKTRILVHLGISILLIFVVLYFKQINDDSVIWKVFAWAGLTYGPLLGLFAYGIFTKLKTNDKIVPIIAIGSVILSYLINIYSKSLFLGYQVGFEILLINGAITFTGLFVAKFTYSETLSNKT